MTTAIPAVITYHKRGTSPPIYVAGTFSDPPWQPHKMDHTAREDGEHYFKKEVYAEPGSKIEYKFRIGDGDLWVLDENTPTVMDSSGNTNHVLEVKPPKKQAEDEDPAKDEAGTRQDAEATGPPSYAKVTAKNLQPPVEAAAGDRSGTGTPIFARVAAEVADSAELLHEEVPERESPEVAAEVADSAELLHEEVPERESPEVAAEVADSAELLHEEVPERKHPEHHPPSPMSETAETAAEVADIAEALDNDENTIFVLEPPPGEGGPFVVQGPGEEPIGDPDSDIAHKSPLFSYECAGLYDSDEEARLASVAEDYDAFEDDEEDDYVGYSAPVDDIDPDKVDINDPTLERFPSARDDIMDAVRKIGTGLQADQVSFGGQPRTSVFNPSRRGTEDITGDHLLTTPIPSSPNMHRTSKKSPRGSISSLNAPASLHSISEADESAIEEEEEEGDFPPAVVFTNPGMKPRPTHLKLFSHEDEGIALPDGVSPRTVKPTYRRIVTPQSPLSPTSGAPARRFSIGAALEISKDRESSMGEAVPRPPPEQKQVEGPPAIAEEGEGADDGESASAMASQSEVVDSTTKGTTATDVDDADEDTGESSQPGESSAPQEEPAKTSTSGALVQAGPGGGWIRAFFRRIFVDFFGGLFGRFWGGSGKATATT